ncbi:uncharacterized protein LOC135485709 [Lineus longissimus]|uniref:uncharacterized protein LOC135485709 n=1 Tax=Lineus longissimus TaxID=88925 RepID=UPI002B4F433D
MEDLFGTHNLGGIRTSKMALTGEEIANLKDIFKEYDLDGNGWITASELPKLLQALGQNPCAAERMRIMKKFDENRDGHLDFGEFVLFWSTYEGKKKPEEVDEELKAAFNFFDKDNNGTIDKFELSKVLTSVGRPEDRMKPAEVDELFREADTDGNGKIEYNEFLYILSGKHLTVYKP